ncbi:carbohydrate porin [Providencia sneebia]|uniref:Carbohydrate-selective porin OprB n=1 Tax=Providencia sneebia DSM 19967 TaxID=1141660 RepID=K8WCD3_9GAMM|nr:carbohydrate porin [Providencia sneebia]EKT58288.1 carbohydrate-selective porin OprB [Providencia sneebia DSM 19967]
MNKNIILSILLFSFPALPALAEYKEWNGTVLGFEAAPVGVFGDMLGIRPILENNGFTFHANYLGQAAYNAKGGYDSNKHTAYIDQFTFMFNQDLERWTGIPDARIEGNIVNRNHEDNLTLKRIQDPRVFNTDQTQESYGGGSITRLGWLTFARSFDDRNITWRVGMMNKAQEFDQIIPCDFQLVTLCGGKSGNAMTWNNWNIHTWGTTLSYKLTPEVTIKTAIMEQNSAAADRNHAWSWSTKGSKGVLLPLEIETRTFVNNLPGAYNLGVLYTNAKQYDLYKDKSYNHTWFMYAGMNQQLTQHEDDPNRGLSLSMSGSYHDERSNYMNYVTSASLRYRGMFDARPEDWVGFGISYVDLSSHYAKSQQMQNAQLNLTDYNDPLYHPIASSAFNAELYYRFKLASWFELQPDLQYWHQPGGVEQTSDAWVLGLKSVVTF